MLQLQAKNNPQFLRVIGFARALSQSLRAFASAFARPTNVTVVVTKTADTKTDTKMQPSMNFASSRSWRLQGLAGSGSAARILFPILATSAGWHVHG
jgi:hypothetical protein